MQSKPIVTCAIAGAVALFALLAGIGAARFYQDQVPEHRAGSGIGLEPLPDWAAEPLPDFSGYANIQEKKEAFFDYLFPRIALANQRILTLREQVKALAEKDSLTPAEGAFLSQQAERLRVEEPLGSDAFFSLLLRRLDYIPPSLVLAQAANESAWGTSRFAREGNNLFGQWCFSRGCGLVPSDRNSGARHEVASFESPYRSVHSYVTNLNRHPSYQALRIERAQLRAENQNPTGPALVSGLQAYSERGEEYIAEILSMMRYNNLQHYDQLFREWIEDDARTDVPYVIRRRQSNTAVN